MKHQCIVVLGMHRGGTSALAGTLRALGVDFGRDLLPPQPDNPLGFFEHRTVVCQHDALLRAAGAAWDEPLPEWSEAEWKKFARGPLGAVCRRLRADFASAPLWGLKDPRMGRFLWLWRPLFGRLGVVPRFLFILRHPGEVAASLGSRDRVDPRAAHLLWLEHVLSAEAATRDASRLFLNYDDLLADWRGVQARISETFGIVWPRSPSEGAVAEEIDGFLQPALRHHRAAPGGGLRAAEEVFDWLSRAPAAAATTPAFPGSDPNLATTLDLRRQLLDELTRRHTEGDRRLRADRARAQEIMDAQAAELETARATERRLRADRAEAQRILDEQLVELTALRRDRADRERVHAAAILAQEAELSGLRAVVATLRADRTEAQRVIDALHTELEALRRDYAALRADRDDAQLIMEVLSADLARLRTTASALANADAAR